MPVHPGQKTPGGRRPGSGRKPDLFIRRCDQLSNDPNFFKWAKAVFAGENVEPHTTKDGVIFTPASVAGRTYLWEKLAGYARGKPVSVLELGEHEGKAAILPAVVILPSPK